MRLLKDVLKNEVYPAFGCTEPIACAYAAAVAAASLGEPVERLTLKVDAGTYKNGAAVIVPRSGGARGNLIAAVMGAALARPELELLLLQEVTAEVLASAQSLIKGGNCRIECVNDEMEFHVDVAVTGCQHNARRGLTGGHTSIERIEKDEQIVFEATHGPEGAVGPAYRHYLKQMSMAEVLSLADDLDDDDESYLRRGVEMNLAMSEWGFEVGGTAHQLRLMQREGFLADDIFFLSPGELKPATSGRN